MKSKSSNVQSFGELEREMREKFSELASAFDFVRAENDAIDSVNQVYRLADKARVILEDEFDFQPSSTILPSHQFQRMQGEISDLRARYLAVECEAINLLSNLGFYGPEGSIAGGGKSRTIAVPAADLQRLAEMIDYIRSGFGAHQDDSSSDDASPADDSAN